MSKIGVQIGTNDASLGDIFSDIFKREKFDFIYLIEPMSGFNCLISEKYAEVNKKILNVAIVPDPEIKTAKLYVLSGNGGHNSLLKRKSHPIRALSSKLDYIIVDCMTFNKFCEDNGLKEINFLCIDTEGLDDEILMSIDFSKVSIKNILWEIWVHDDDDEDGNYNVGKEIHEKVISKLTGLGYKITNYDESNLLAVK